jgi:hypothetical protein
MMFAGLIVAFTADDPNAVFITLLVAWVITSEGTKLVPPL